MPLKIHVYVLSKFEHSLAPNVFTKSFQLTITRKLELMILLDSQNQIEHEQYFSFVSMCQQ